MDVIKSLLACDLLGFHLFEYARNFLTACRRLCGHTMQVKPGGHFAIQCLGRNVVLRVAHVGI
jgi:trehalose 6-phosphate synthase/phosphatase